MDNQTPHASGAPFGNSPFGDPMGLRPKNWLIEAILVTIFCCFPFGIVAIIKAASVNSFYDSGNYAGAQAASAEAAKWTKIAFFISLLGWLIYVLLVFLVGLGGFLSFI